MKERVLRPERMDDPELAADLHRQALRGLQRINWWSRNARTAWQPIHHLARSLQQDRLSVLDVATGAGDVPIAMAGYAAAVNLELEIDACDISPRAIAMAETNAADQRAPVRFFQLNVLSEDIPRTYDVVISTTFLHHLSTDEAIHLLRKMRAAARHRVVIVDLVRSQLNWWQVWLAAYALSRSSVVHFDGPQSVRAAFTRREVVRLAEQAGLVDIHTYSAWPCRFVLIGSVSG